MKRQFISDTGEETLQIHCSGLLGERALRVNISDASGIRLRAALLQTRGGTSSPRDKAPDNSIPIPIAFASKSMSRAERIYSNIERETLGILHRLAKFNHYCFVREVHIITEHKPLVAIFKKDIAMLSKRIQ